MNCFLHRHRMVIKILVSLLLSLFASTFISFDFKGMGILRSMVQILDNGFRIGVLALAVFGIVHCEQALTELKRQGMRKHWIYSLVLSGIFIMGFNPMAEENTVLTDFVRIIGNGVIRNYDVSRVIGNFTKWFLMFGILFFLIALSMSYVRKRECTVEQNAAWACLDDFMVIAGVNLALRTITFFFDESQSSQLFYYSTHLICLVEAALLLFIIFRLDQKITFNQFFSVILIAISMSYPILLAIEREEKDGMLLFWTQTVLLLMFIAGIRWFALSAVQAKNRQVFLTSATTAASFFPLALSLYMEGIHILAARGVFLNSAMDLFVIPVFVLIFGFVTLYVGLIRGKWKLFDEKKIACPILVLGVAALSVQVPLTSTYITDLMESANSSVLITDFLNYGTIPVVERYGGHMMSDVWEGILYGLLNQDYLGAAFSPYRVYCIPVVCLLLYFLVKEVWNEKAAMLSVILIPMYDFISYFSMGLFVVIAVALFIKEQSYRNAAFVWFACVWCTLYRLDLGYAFDIACVTTLAVYILMEKRWSAIRPLAVTFAAYVLFFGAMWFILCWAKGINPISRLLEFVKIGMSNANWAYNSIGDMGNMKFFWHYIFLPIAVECTLLYSLIAQKRKRKFETIPFFLMVLLAVSYFVNFSRGLVRHSLVENAMTIISWSAYLYLAVFFAGILNKKAFLPAFVCFMLLQSLFYGQENFSRASIGDLAGSKIAQTLRAYDNEYQQAKETGSVERVVISEEQLNQMRPYKEVSDLLLKEDETFLDYSNKSFLWSYLQKNDPVYVSQSPLQLSGEFTQDCFIEQIDSSLEKVPIVFVEDTYLDGISDVYRYYKVSEYLWQNYVPLCQNESVQVWCLAERYEEMVEVISQTQQMVFSENFDQMLVTHNLLASFEGTTLQLTATGTDPFLENFGDFLNLNEFVGTTVKIAITYTCDAEGTLQMYYTEQEGEDFSEEKSIRVELRSDDEALFAVPVTEFSRIRLDIPEGSKVNITSVCVSPNLLRKLDYGYDRYSRVEGSTDYIDEAKGSAHIYNLEQLPRIWAEMDPEQAVDNLIVGELQQQGENYRLVAPVENKESGNYLHIRTQAQASGLMTVRVGEMSQGTFVEKIRYTMRVEEGVHDYLIRISSDYYWYAEELDTVRIESDTSLSDTQLRVLAGEA